MKFNQNKFKNAVKIAIFSMAFLIAPIAFGAECDSTGNVPCEYQGKTYTQLLDWYFMYEGTPRRFLNMGTAETVYSINEQNNWQAVGDQYGCYYELSGSCSLNGGNVTNTFSVTLTTENKVDTNIGIFQNIYPVYTEGEENEPENDSIYTGMFTEVANEIINILSIIVPIAMLIFSFYIVFKFVKYSLFLDDVIAKRQKEGFYADKSESK